MIEEEFPTFNGSERQPSPYDIASGSMDIQVRTFPSDAELMERHTALYLFASSDSVFSPVASHNDPGTLFFSKESDGKIRVKFPYSVSHLHT